MPAAQDKCPSNGVLPQRTESYKEITFFYKQVDATSTRFYRLFNVTINVLVDHSCLIDIPFVTN